LTSTTTQNLAPNFSSRGAFRAPGDDGPAFLAFGGAIPYEHFVQSRQPTRLEALRWVPDLRIVTMTPAVGAFVAIVGRDLLEHAQLTALDWEQTGGVANLTCIVLRQPGHGARPTSRDADPVDPAPTPLDALERIRARSGLTLEQIAPLAGVSRRSVQKWRAGEPISGRKAARLRAVADFLEMLGATEPRDIQTLLFAHKPHEISLYDLLREGRFESAIAQVTGARHSVSEAELKEIATSPTSPVTRMDLREAGVSAPAGSLRANRTRRVKAPG